MKDKLEWIKEHYPNIKSYPPPDYMVIAYLEYCVNELCTQLDALPHLRGIKSEIDAVLPPDAPMPPIISYPLICHCETFEGDGIECLRCGGLLF